MMRFKSFGSAAKIIAGIETMHKVRTGQLCASESHAFSLAECSNGLATA